MTARADTRLRRLPERGNKDMRTACRIIDDARICHVGFALEGQPYVIPMALGRDGDRILLHGSVVGRLMTSLAKGLPCCVTVTHLDGLVLARSSFNSSMNYRSLMVFGTATLVSDEAEKKRGLDILTEHLAPGRLADLRPSTRKELNATTLLALPLETFSVKSRTGPPEDAKRDLDTPVWAGVIPLTLAAGEPVPEPGLPAGTPLPEYLKSS